MIKGTIYKAHAQKDIQQTRPLYAFVPSELVKGGKLDAIGYSSKRWDSINCGANEEAVGSHLFPDVSQPIKQGDIASNPILNKFFERLKKLTQKSHGKATTFRKPGLAEIKFQEKEIS